MNNTPIFVDNSEAAQCARMLDLLKMRTVGCREARKAYAIRDPLACVQALRRQGLRILCIWRWRQLACGIYIRSRKYLLCGGHDDQQ